MSGAHDATPRSRDAGPEPRVARRSTGGLGDRFARHGADLQRSERCPSTTPGSSLASRPDGRTSWRRAQRRPSIAPRPGRSAARVRRPSRPLELDVELGARRSDVRPEGAARIRRLEPPPPRRGHPRLRELGRRAGIRTSASTPSPTSAASSSSTPTEPWTSPAAASSPRPTRAATSTGQASTTSPSSTRSSITSRRRMPSIPLGSTPSGTRTADSSLTGWPAISRHASPPLSASKGRCGTMRRGARPTQDDVAVLEVHGSRRRRHQPRGGNVVDGYPGSRIPAPRADPRELGLRSMAARGRRPRASTPATSTARRRQATTAQRWTGCRTDVELWMNQGRDPHSRAHVRLARGDRGLSDGALQEQHPGLGSAPVWRSLP